MELSEMHAGWQLFAGGMVCLLNCDILQSRSHCVACFCIHQESGPMPWNKSSLLLNFLGAIFILLCSFLHGVWLVWKEKLHPICLAQQPDSSKDMTQFPQDECHGENVSSHYFFFVTESKFKWQLLNSPSYYRGFEVLDWNMDCICCIWKCHIYVALLYIAQCSETQSQCRATWGKHCWIW